MPLIGLLLGLAGCVGPKSAPDSPDETSGLDSDTIVAEEVCDGVDNDGDGVIDEESADLDGDGVADCVDTACELPAEDTGAVADDSECGTPGTPAVSPWSIEPLWSTSSVLGCFNARILDLDADGVADIACVDDTAGQLQVYRGDDGSLEWQDRGFAPGSGLAIADVNADGTPEIVGFDRSGALVARDPSGSVVWTGDTDLLEDGLEFNPIAVRDVDGDGLPEVIVRRGLVSGLDGSLTSGFEPSLEPTRDWEAEVAVGDIDQSGVVEVASGWEVRSLDGEDRVDPNLDGWDGTITPLFVQADADPAGEVVWFGDAGFIVVDDDGTVLTTVVSDLLTYSLPCAGDVDGDGETELISAGVGVIAAFDLDGAIGWTAPSDDSSGSYVACTTFDFDGDGAKEVVVGDEYSMYVLDGPSGATRYQDTRWSNTFGDVAAVVDLDGDGSVEILMSNPYGTGYDGAPLRAWRNVNGDWPPGTMAWPTSNWSGVGMLADGTVLSSPEEPWLTTGVWRGQAEWPTLGADLTAEVDPSCASACEAPGRVRVRVRLVNRGPSETPAGTPLAVYTRAADGTEALLDVFRTADVVAAGARSESWEIEAAVGDVAGLRLVAGDAGTGHVGARDCAPGNNVTEWTNDACGP